MGCGCCKPRRHARRDELLGVDAATKLVVLWWWCSTCVGMLSLCGASCTAGGRLFSASAVVGSLHRLGDDKAAKLRLIAALL